MNQTARASIEVGDIKKEYDEILRRLGDPELISDWEKFEELSRQKNICEEILAKYEESQKILQELEENKLIAAGANEDLELSSLAQEEIKFLQQRGNRLETELRELLEKKDEVLRPDSQKSGAQNQDLQMNSLIIEIRAGVGGEEAALFAADLFKMYMKYGQSRGWKTKILDASPTEIGGYKEIIFEIKGQNVWQELRYEGGVHRVQRVPKTEKSGRVHTSTCSVAVLPKPKKASIDIKTRDLRIDTYRASGPGGQYVNKRETAVRITHLPTGIVVSSQTERSLLQNKENAISILEAKLLEKSQTEEEEKMHGKRKAQIKRAKRAEKIRTYNFPQDRITDHRVKKSWHGIANIMAGNPKGIIKALQNDPALNTD